jgi:hypothetical protein
MTLSKSGTMEQSSSSQLRPSSHSSHSTEKPEPGQISTKKMTAIMVTPRPPSVSPPRTSNKSPQRPQDGCPSVQTRWCSDRLLPMSLQCCSCSTRCNHCLILHLNTRRAVTGPVFPVGAYPISFFPSACCWLFLLRTSGDPETFARTCSAPPCPFVSWPMYTNTRVVSAVQRKDWACKRKRTTVAVKL